MVEFMDTLLEKRRSFIAVIALIITLLLFSILAPILQLQAHQASIAVQAQASYSTQESQGSISSPNVITDAMSQMAGDVRQSINNVEYNFLRSVMWTAGSITQFERYVLRGTSTAYLATEHAIYKGTTSMVYAIGDGFADVGHAIVYSVTSTGHIIGNVYGFLTRLAHVSSFIRPPDHTPIPKITQVRALQASIIQSGTKVVALPSMINGTGGACDDGNGNGGYPLSWCSAPMDTIATLPFNNDPINRECTSYAYWYFTTIEGHTDFQAWGNAKYWGGTSNYPTHGLPAVGAIAVETAGAYGHVAIVQALPGQEYDGQVVPSGYVLVSEMNYDWHGHFRFSYSPLSKFTTYIYP